MKCFVLAILWTALMVNGEKPKAQSNTHESNPGHATQQTDTAPSRPVVVVNQNAPKGQENNHPDQSKNYLARLFSLENLPNIALVIVGIAGIVVAICTLKDIQKQTINTGTAAKAALLNAEALIHSERPWIMIQIQEALVEKGDGVFDMRSFQFTIFNYGKSPAHVVSCKGPKIEFCDDPEKDLPIQPDYGTWDWERRFLAPQDSLPIGKIIYPSKMRMETHSVAIAKHERVKNELVVYGLIEYTDGISSKNYRTAFCYRHEKLPPSSMGGHMLICGLSVYNEYT
jgi:hypothetical protein